VVTTRAVCSRPGTADSWVQSQASPCGVEKFGNLTGVTPSTSVFLAVSIILITLHAHIHLYRVCW